MISLTTPRFKYILIAIGVVLCIPLVAMQFTTEVNWKLFDFIVAFVLLLGLGIFIEYILQKRKGTTSKKNAWILIAVCIFLLIWAELAVGVFGTPLAGN